MKTDRQTTIDNLRELASHAEAYYEANDPSRFDMTAFKAVYGKDENGSKELEGEFDRGEDVPEEYECKTSCCLLGIADLAGMGENVPGDFLTLSDALFPIFEADESCSREEHTEQWNSLFGAHLPSDMGARVAGLRFAADELERTGRYIPA